MRNDTLNFVKNEFRVENIRLQNHNCFNKINNFKNIIFKEKDPLINDDSNSELCGIRISNFFFILYKNSLNSNIKEQFINSTSCALTIENRTFDCYHCQNNCFNILEIQDILLNKKEGVLKVCNWI